LIGLVRRPTVKSTAPPGANGQIDTPRGGVHA